jgi:hypothetical protein
MTDKQALTQARKRWGKTGAVQQRQKRTLSERTGAVLVDTHAVGHIAMGLFFAVQGQGPNWVGAFEDADRKAERDAERFREIASGTEVERP